MLRWSLVGLQPLSARSTFSVTWPSSVNLKALESRFLITCCRRLSSVYIDARQAPGRARPRSRASCPAATWRKVRSTWSRRLGEATSRRCPAVTVPDSILDRSRMSLIRPSRSVPAAWMVSANSTCLSVRLPSGVLGQQLGQDQQAVQRRAQLVAHVGQELGLVLGGQRQLLGLLLQRRAWPARPRGSWLPPAGSGPRAGAPSPRSSSLVCCSSSCLVREQFLGLTQRRGLLLQALVGLLQLLLLRLQLGGQQLRLLEQALGPHVGGDGVEHDADGLGQLVEEGRWISLNSPKVASSITAFTSPSNSTGRTMMLSGGASPRPGADLDVVVGHVGEQDALLLVGALADQALAAAGTGWPGACARCRRSWRAASAPAGPRRRGR